MGAKEGRTYGCSQKQIAEIGSHRFADVFTKLRALEQTEFSKVVLIDLDTIVVQSIDELFGYTAPSALFRGNEYAAAGTKRAGKTLFNRAQVVHEGALMQV